MYLQVFICYEPNSVWALWYKSPEHELPDAYCTTNPLFAKLEILPSLELSQILGAITNNTADFETISSLCNLQQAWSSLTRDSLSDWKVDLLFCFVYYKKNPRICSVLPKRWSMGRNQQVSDILFALTGQVTTPRITLAAPVGCMLTSNIFLWTFCLPIF